MQHVDAVYKAYLGKVNELVAEWIDPKITLLGKLWVSELHLQCPGLAENLSVID